MAEIFRAKARGAADFEKIVAIKRILPQMADDQEFVDMFIDEAKTVAQLSHANICQIFEFGHQDGTYFIALELVEGKDLKQVMVMRRRQGQAAPLPMVLAIMGKVCEALEYAHNCKTPQGEPMNIVHRDVSPQNVLVSYLGSVKLIDFGIAKAMGRLTKTSAGNIKGKFSYMSPEQVSAKPTIDHRSDIFACGTVLWEALTNKRLFKAENEIVTMQMVRKAEIQPPSEVNPDLPKGIDRIVLRALAREPGQRYQGAGDLLDDLEQFAAQSDNVCTSRQLARWMKEVFAADYKKSRTRKESNEVVMLGEANRKPAVEDSQPSLSAQVPAPEDTGQSQQREISQPSVPNAQAPWHEQSQSGISHVGVTGPGTGSYSGSYPGSDMSGSYERAPRRRSSKAPLYFGIVLAAILLGSAAAFFLTRPPKESPTPDKKAPVVASNTSQPKATAPPVAPEKAATPTPDVPEKTTPDETPPPATAEGGDEVTAAPETGDGKRRKRRRRRGESSEARAAAMEAAMARATAMAKTTSDEAKPKDTPAPVTKTDPTPAKVEPKAPDPPPKAPTPPPVEEKKPAPPPEKTKADPPPVAAPQEKGSLVIASKPWAKVIVDGRETGLNTPIPPGKAIKLSPGKHWVTLIAEGKKFSYSVIIRPGKITRLIKNLPVK